MRSLAQTITAAVIVSLTDDPSSLSAPQVPTTVKTLQERNCYLQTAIKALHFHSVQEQSALKEENRQLAVNIATSDAELLQANALLKDATNKCEKLEGDLASERFSAATLRAEHDDLVEKVNELSADKARLEEALASSDTLINDLKDKCNGLESDLAAISSQQNALVPLSHFSDDRSVDVSDRTRDDLRLGQATEVMLSKMNDTLSNLPDGSAMSFLHVTKGPSK